MTLVERLRAAQLRGNTVPADMHLLEEAADRIAELEKENSKLITKMKEGTGPIFAWLTEEMHKVKPLEKRIIWLEGELKQNRDIAVEYIDTLEANNAILQARAERAESALADAQGAFLDEQEERQRAEAALRGVGKLPDKWDEEENRVTGHMAANNGYTCANELRAILDELCSRY